MMSQEFSLFDPITSDASEYATFLAKFLNKLNNKYFPICAKQFSHKRLKSPWVTSSILQCIRKKHRWYRLVRTAKITPRSYDLYVKSLRNLMKTAEQQYYVRRFDSLGNDIKKNWKILNGLLGKSKAKLSDHFILNNEKVYNSDRISEAFGRYFIENPRTINNSIPQCNASFSNRIPTNDNTMFFYHVTASEISASIMKLKKNGQISDVSKKLLLLCIDYASFHVCELFNLCIDKY